MLSVSGFASSNLRLTGEEKVFPKPKFKQIDFACPICKYPLGSGGNLNLSFYTSYKIDWILKN